MKWPWAKKQQGRQPKFMEGQGEYVFRRSRTLTGTTSSKVPASAESRGQLKTDRLKTHERNQHLRRFARLVFGVGIFVAFMWFLAAMFIRTPAISYVPGQQTPRTLDYQASIVEFMNKTMYDHFGFLLRPDALETYIKQKHSEVKSVVVTRTWYGGDPTFTIGFRKPLLVWQTGGQRFYVDEQGVAFVYNHYGEPEVLVTDESGISPEVSGGAVASSRFIAFLGQLVGEVNLYGKGKVVAVIVPPSTRQIDLKLEGREYPIKTHIDRDPIEQAEDIANTLNYLDSKGIKPAYIDVRVAHKAFYK